MNWFQKYKIAVVCILLPAMLMLAGNAVFNWHVHKSEKGQLFVHAHPFNKSVACSYADDCANNPVKNGAKHSHNSSECFSIDKITNFLFVLAAVIVVLCNRNRFVESSKVYHYHVKKNLLASLLPNRAPPVLA
ncbi:hypothetical protein [Marinifilum caeruleilacunae]|uniref:Uncharacterized protein n=1 Tax=Marinifilum caeruleilacunae TaxID=2499076 RepID=A0ABX1WYR6_9BACT|nr:hypothetical protein [Marinifilum caeruleilacunae]NOU61244.1 hypothetical protein [Marinifilum caeruleilacunae]